MTFSDETVLSVKALNDLAKRLIDNSSYLSSVNIKGEISNFTNHYKSGHLYFSVKDDQAQLRCVMFSSAASKLTFVPENGMKVILHGRASLFVRDGQFIFYVDKMSVDGIGDLYLQFEELKKKLTSEGLFAREHKKPLPRYPKRIGVITSDTGAAVQDIKNVIFRRYPLAEILLYPSLVQGSGAEGDLCRAISRFTDRCDVDVIIIGRGGGSIEDLWAFNSEKLARLIYACPIPVISAVGHETDFTICDFVSDLRAPTPSAAAELAVPDRNDLKRQLNNVIIKMQNTLHNRINLKRSRVERLSECRFFKSPTAMIDEKRLHTDRLSELLALRMQRKVEAARTRTEYVYSNMTSAIRSKTESDRRKYIYLTSKLEALNPMSVISRGYSAVFDGDNKLIKSIDSVEVGKEFSVRLADGTVSAEAKSVRRNDDE
ncbi:MAG: exodeoxyribonuclease VII large subunit [Ruminococcaceae bacterium]|nr:exodeoxyribonuclease VII large subunit [Oscillospiraceae bacterium]